MNAERLSELAAIWGGDLRRWPETDAATARAFMTAYPVEAERALFDARQLDAALDAAPVSRVSAALRARVIASAASAGLKASAVWPAFRRLLWIGGAGWAAAACAGVIFGINLSGNSATDDQTDAVLDQAFVTPLDDTEYLG